MVSRIDTTETLHRHDSQHCKEDECQNSTEQADNIDTAVGVSAAAGVVGRHETEELAVSLFFSGCKSSTMTKRDATKAVVLQ